jgi:hypothetical protein
VGVGPVDVEPVDVEPAFPGVDRMVLAVSGVGVFLAAVNLASSWSVYRSPVAALLLWCVTAATVPLAQRSMRRTGRLTTRATVIVVVVLAALDIAVPQTAPPRNWLQIAAWNWGAIALILFALAVYRPVREIYLLTVGHAMLGLVLLPWMPVRDPVEIIQFVAGAVIPPLAAAHYLALYAEGLRNRQRAVEEHRRSVAAAAAEEESRRLMDERLASIRPSILGVLRAVVAGRGAPIDPAARDRARALSDRLRRELDESLAAARSQLPLSPPVDADSSAQVDVLGSPALLPEPDRVTLAAIVDVLAGCPGWLRIGVTVASAGPTEPVSVLVVATSNRSVQTPAALTALVTQLGATVWQEEGSLVIETQRQMNRFSDSEIAVSGTMKS